jgi:hypothetical protein
MWLSNLNSRQNPPGIGLIRFGARSVWREWIPGFAIGPEGEMGVHRFFVAAYRGWFARNRGFYALGFQVFSSGEIE